MSQFYRENHKEDEEKGGEASDQQAADAEQTMVEDRNLRHFYLQQRKEQLKARQSQKRIRRALETTQKTNMSVKYASRPDACY